MRLVSLRGSSFEMGLMHGETLRESIEAVVKIYMDLFFALGGGARDSIRELALAFAERIERFDSRYMEEIRGIAIGSSLDVRDILAINARTEILTSLLAAGKECTLFCFVKEGILAQTWDWLQRLEGKVVLLEIERDDGPTVLTMTEPGIVGKIGINSAGLGVGLNILSSAHRASGVPVHILLRAALDSPSWDVARERLTKSQVGTNSAITLADDRGRCFICEYKGGELQIVEPRNGVLVHTNHYLAEVAESPIPNSEPRLARAISLIEKLHERSVESAKEILGDRVSGLGTICVPWRDEGEWGHMGTVSSVVMDLRARKLHVSRNGPGSCNSVRGDMNYVDIPYDEHAI